MKLIEKQLLSEARELLRRDETQGKDPAGVVAALDALIDAKLKTMVQAEDRQASLRLVAKQDVDPE